MTKFKIKSEATSVASPRSRKAGQKAMDKTTQELQVLVKNLERLMGENVQLEVEPNVIITDIGHNKKDKKKLN
jgi:regulator of replication initiation timing